MGGSVTKGLVISLMALGGPGCLSGPGEPTGDTGFPFAYVHDDCAPWDGHALTILLTHSPVDDSLEVDYPLLRVTSWRPPGRLGGSSVRWDGTDSNDGFAALCESSEACVPATSVRIRFDGGQPADQRVTGALDVELEDGRVVRGPFDAVRLGYGMLCG